MMLNRDLYTRILVLLLLIMFGVSLSSGCGGGGGGTPAVNINESEKLVKPNFSFSLKFMSPDGRSMAAPSLSTPGEVSVTLISAATKATYGPKTAKYSQGEIRISEEEIAEGTYTVSLNATLKLQSTDTFETIFQGSSSGAEVSEGKITQVDIYINNTGKTVSLAPAALKFNGFPKSVYNAGELLMPSGQPMNLYVLDKYGAILTSASGTLTICWVKDGIEHDNLSGQVVNGIASFSNLTAPSVSGAITGKAVFGSLTGTSSPITINYTPPASAAKLAFASQPQSPITAGNVWPSFGVYVQDAAGNTVTTANNSVSLYYSSTSNPSGVLLKTVTAVNGLATFSGVTVPNVTGSITLRASSSPLTDATSTVTVNSTQSGVKLAFTTPPQTPMSPGGTWLDFAVTVQDAAGSTVSSASDVIVLSYYTASNPALVSLASKAAVNGVATFSGVKAPNVSEGSITLKAESGSMTAALANVSILNQAFNVYASTPQGIYSYNFGFDVSNPSSKLVNMTSTVPTWEISYYSFFGRQIKKMKASASRNMLYVFDDGNHVVQIDSMNSGSIADFDLTGLPGPIINFAVSIDGNYLYLLTTTSVSKYEITSRTIPLGMTLNITGSPRNLIEYSPGMVFVAFDNKVTPVNFTGTSATTGTDLSFVGTPSGLDRDGLDSDVFIAEYTGNAVYRLLPTSFTSGPIVNLGSGKPSAQSTDTAMVKVVNISGNKKIFLAKTGDTTPYSYNYTTGATTAIQPPTVSLGTLTPSDMDISAGAYFLLMSQSDVNGFIRVIDTELNVSLKDYSLKDSSGTQLSYINGLIVR